MGDNNMGQINVTEARVAVERIKKISNKLDTLFEEWKSMRESALTDETFRSEAATAYNTKFRSLDGPFAGFVASVATKAKELDKAINDYEAMIKGELNQIEDINVPH